MRKTHLFTLTVIHKLYLTPGFVLIALLFIALLSMQTMKKQEVLLAELYTKTFVEYKESNSLLNNVMDIHQNLYRAVSWANAHYSQDKIDSLRNQQKALLKVESDKIKMSLNRQDLDTISKKTFMLLDSQMTAYNKWANRVVDMLEADLALATTFIKSADPYYVSTLRTLQQYKQSRQNEMEINYTKSQTENKKNSMLLTIFSIGAFIISLAIVLFFSRSIAIPINRLVTFLRSMTEGEWNLHNRISNTSTDEIGILSQWINNFIEKLQTIIKELARQSVAMTQSMQKLVDSASTISENAQLMKTKTINANEGALRISEYIHSVVSTTSTISMNLKNSTENLDSVNHSIIDISRNCEHASSIAGQSNTLTHDTLVLFKHLVESSTEINSITEVINEIAEETNLLALNANIEAMRAGDSGKGFAIVAQEVKKLSQQTAFSTEQINEQITTLQKMTSDAEIAVKKIADTVSSLNTISATITLKIKDQASLMTQIASRISESSVATENIVAKIKESDSDLSTISSAIDEIKQGAGIAADSISSIRDNAEQLEQLSNNLGMIVSQFKS